MSALTVQQVAENLGVAPATVRRLIARGELRAGKVGAAVRISREALAEYRIACGLDSPAPPAAVVRLVVPELDDDEAVGQRLAREQRLR